jgi:hypothetical protein
LSRAQQDYLVRNFAKQYGISDPAQQDTFIAALRDLQVSPYFRPERLMSGMGEWLQRPPPSPPRPSTSTQ